MLTAESYNPNSQVLLICALRIVLYINGSCRFLTLESRQWQKAEVDQANETSVVCPGELV